MLDINSDCIRCGLCILDCPTKIIAMEDSGPAIQKNACLGCGHCEAICPTGALYNRFMNHDEPLEIQQYPVLDSKTAELFLRSRRSIRLYKDTLVPKEETEKLLNIGRYAPTGSNRQGVSYLVVSDEEIMLKLKNMTLEYFIIHPDPDIRAMHREFAKNGQDRIFRGAPMCILALTKKGDSYTAVNPRYCLTYIELFAPSLGLGTCWAGYLERFLKTDTPEMRGLLQIPEDLVVGGALLYGYPQYQYKRAANREPLKAYWR